MKLSKIFLNLTCILMFFKGISAAATTSQESALFRFISILGLKGIEKLMQSLNSNGTKYRHFCQKSDTLTNESFEKLLLAAKNFHEFDNRINLENFLEKITFILNTFDFNEVLVDKFFLPVTIVSDDHQCTLSNDEFIIFKRAVLLFECLWDMNW